MYKLVSYDQKGPSAVEVMFSLCGVFLSPGASSPTTLCSVLLIAVPRGTQYPGRLDVKLQAQNPRVAANTMQYTRLDG